MWWNNSQSFEKNIHNTNKNLNLCTELLKIIKEILW